MDHEFLGRVVVDESAALLAAASAAGPGDAVPGCPDWTVNDLVWHIGTVQDFWAFVVTESAPTPESYPKPLRPEGATPAESFALLRTFAAARAATLAQVLRAADPADRVWTWTGPQPVAWVLRRMAHEVAVHRFDAERSAGREHRLDPALAADGIDEFLTIMTALPPQGSPLAGTVHLHCTDTAGEWTVGLDGDGRYVVRREHAKGDVALRGASHDLLMVLWGRVGRATVESFGDPALADAFLAGLRRG